MPVSATSATQPQAAATGISRDVRRPEARGGSASVSPPSVEPTAQAEGPERPSTVRRPTGATAYDPTEDHDDEAPEPVREVDKPTVSRDTLELAWAPAADNVGVVAYKIWLNGFPVATTTDTHATLRWFNDDATQQAVQIRALDAAGNQSESSLTIVVSRPEAEPTPTPTPEPSETPSPKPSSSQPTVNATTPSDAAPTEGPAENP